MIDTEPTVDHSRWMWRAMEVASQALPEDVPIGAVLVKDNQVIAEACNRREKDNDPTAHAEMLVLREAGKALESWRLSGTTLYVTLEPCTMCAAAISQSRVSQVVFGAYDLNQGACGSVFHLLQNTNVELTGGILEEECHFVLKEFFEMKR